MVGSLQTYESKLPYQKKGKSIALKSIMIEHDNSSDDDLNSEHIAPVDRKFWKFMFIKRTMVKIKKKAKIILKETSQKIVVRIKLNIWKELSVLNAHYMVS